MKQVTYKLPTPAGYKSCGRLQYDRIMILSTNGEYSRSDIPGQKTKKSLNRFIKLVSAIIYNAGSGT